MNQLSGFWSSFVRNGKLFTAISSTIGKYPATIGCCHALAETVLILSFLSGRLECAFHVLSALLNFLKGCKNVQDYPDLQDCLC